MQGTSLVLVDDFSPVHGAFSISAPLFTDNHTWFCAMDVDSYFGLRHARSRCVVHLKLQAGFQELYAVVGPLPGYRQKASSLANQRESQSLMTPTRMPCGLTFCPIVYLLLWLFLLFENDCDVGCSLEIL